MTPLQYFKQNPDFKVTQVHQLKASNNKTLIVVVIDGYQQVSWDNLNTPIFRNHFKTDMSINFHKWLKSYMQKRIDAVVAGQEVAFNANVKFCN